MEMRRYRLTFFFSLAALVAIGLAALMVNGVTGRLAEQSLVKQAEADTVQKGLHMESMMRSLYVTHGGSPTEPMTLEFLASSKGLASHYPVMAEGFRILKFNLFDLNGKPLWGSDLRSEARQGHPSDLASRPAFRSADTDHRPRQRPGSGCGRCRPGVGMGSH
jgi:hypothetical protein